MDVEMKIQEPINKVTRKQKLKNYSKHPGSFLLALLTKLAILLTVLAPVSYTHLDVYKRQEYGTASAGSDFKTAGVEFFHKRIRIEYEK